MVRILNKIKDSERDLLNLNTNFDRISLDIAERDGSYSTTGSATISALGSGESQEIEVNILDTVKKYEAGRLPIIPRMDLFVDQDANFLSVFPFGSNLSASAVHGISVDFYQSRTTLNAQTNEKGTFVVVIHNNDSVSHDFYFYFDAYYVPAPQKGVANRAS